MLSTATLQDAQTAWRESRGVMNNLGFVFPSTIRSWIPDSWKEDPDLADDEMPRLAMDAPPLLFTDPNSAVPAILTTLIDPDVFRILFAPNKAAEVLGEEKKGTWLDDIAMFPVIEATGEVSSYGDYNNNGNAGINTGWPARQNYLFQVIKEYGEREMERGGLARINWVSEIDKAAAVTINKFLNYSYLFGILGLQNFGFANDPNLSAALTPSTKTAGGTAWIVSGRINATANEIYADIEALYYQLVVQTAGLIDQDTNLVLALSPGAAVALTATNSFNVNVSDLLKKNFPNIDIVTIPQFAARGPLNNNQGVAAGEWVMLFAREVEGQKTVYAAYSEKMRAHPVIRDLSAFRQKVSAGTWGSILRMPGASAQMVGV